MGLKKCWNRLTTEYDLESYKEWFHSKMFETEILEVVMLWVMGPFMDVDVTKNDDQGSGWEKGNKSDTTPNEGGEYCSWLL